MTRLPSPPEPGRPDRIDPALVVWKSGRTLMRCHHVAFGATEFNPGLGRGGRFDPIRDESGAAVPTLYAASDTEGALSETVFHNVPARGKAKRVSRSAVLRMIFSPLACGRDLVLAQLFGLGLKRLGTTRAELIESEASAYPRTRLWAEALHAGPKRIDGLVWVSRQNDGAQAVILFGDRVARQELEITDAPLPLAFGRGLEELQSAAERAKILLYD